MKGCSGIHLGNLGLCSRQPDGSLILGVIPSKSRLVQTPELRVVRVVCVLGWAMYSRNVHACVALRSGSRSRGAVAWSTRHRDAGVQSGERRQAGDASRRHGRTGMAVPLAKSGHYDDGIQDH